MSAQIFTWSDGTVVDVLKIQSPFSDKHEPPDFTSFKKDLDLAISYRLGLEHRLSKKKLSSISNNTETRKHQAVNVTFDNNSSNQYTIVEVIAHDSAGLLYVITKTLSYFQINIFQAKIGGRSDQVVDVFYILDQNNDKLTDSILIDEIRQSLAHAASSLKVGK